MILEDGMASMIDIQGTHGFPLTILLYSRRATRQHNGSHRTRSGAKITHRNAHLQSSWNTGPARIHTGDIEEGVGMVGGTAAHVSACVCIVVFISFTRLVELRFKRCCSCRERTRQWSVLLSVPTPNSLSLAKSAPHMHTTAEVQGVS